MEQIEQHTHHLRAEISDPLDKSLVWRFDDRFNAMLSEFAQNRAEDVLASLRNIFQHEWHAKINKFIPAEIRNQLGPLSKLNKEQLMLAKPATGSEPAIVALWWPWGHGGTYSLRIFTLNSDFDLIPIPVHKPSLFSRVRGIFT
jgi:hypothetical protein